MTAKKATFAGRLAVPAHLRERAQQWFARQMTKCQQAHGQRWPEHQDWLAEYLNRDLEIRAKGVSHEH